MIVDAHRPVAEDHLAALVSIFGLGRTTVHWNVIFGGAALSGVAALFFRRRMGPHHTTAYRLPTVPERDTSSSPDDRSPPPAAS